MRTAIAMLLVALTVPTSAATLEGEVIKIVDGDTIDALDADQATHRVRLHGIDTHDAKSSFSTTTREMTTNDAKVIRPIYNASRHLYSC